MKLRVLASVGVAAAIAFAQPVIYLAQEAGKAAEILARARKAIGAGKIDTLETFSVHSAVQRNVSTMQIDSDVEILLEFPDKYARIENSSGAGGLVLAGGDTSGFNGDHPLQKFAAGMPGGAMVIRMGGGGTFSGGGNEKPTPEQLEQMSRTA